jgi:hypothetical protein
MVENFDLKIIPVWIAYSAAMSDTHRQRLKGLLRSLPQGAKAPLARICGFKDRRLLWALTRHGWWFPTVRERLVLVMDAIESGELILMDTGRRCSNPAYPVLVWQWREKTSSTRLTAVW